MAMFKSCLYCRHRKKKCVLPPSSAPDTRCLACQHLNITCEVGMRKPSLKRQQRSQQIASSLSEQLLLSPTSPVFPSGAHSRSVVVEVSNGDCQVPRSDAEPPANKIIIAEASQEQTRDLSTRETYHIIVRRETPFIPEDYLDGPEETQVVLSCCISLAAQLFLQKQCLGISEEDIEKLCGFLEGYDAFAAVSLIDDSFELQMALAAGTLTAHTWLNLVGYGPQAPTLPPSMLLDYASTLDQATFAPHYLKLTHLAASFLDLSRSTGQENPSRDTIQSWARLEYTCLLNVAQMPSEFLDVRDEMPATPAAVVTHMLQSLIYLRLYRYILTENLILGQSLGLRPVPGVLHFICAIARSIFICPLQIREYWPLLDDVQATAAQILLDFWQITKAENCRALLNLWDPAPGRFEDLNNTVRGQIGHGPWAVEVIDGYSVFWTFRDLRSLSLEVHMRP